MECITPKFRVSLANDWHHSKFRVSLADGVASLDVGLLAEAAQVGQQELDEEVGLLRVGHPQDRAAIARFCVVAARRETVPHMQHLLPSTTIMISDKERSTFAYDEATISF